MKKIKRTKQFLMSFLILACGTIFINQAQAYTHEVRQGGSGYIWRVNDVDQGSTSSLTTAIENAMGSNRDIHILTGGTLTSTINVSHSGVRLHGHGNTFTCNFSGSGILNNGNDGFEVHDLTLRNVVGGYGIRSSAASNLSFTDLSLIDIDWIGIRIDSRTSNPWNYTEYDLYMRDIYVENIGSHGIETYSIDGVDFDGTMTARSTGGCGVLLNQSHNGTVENVDAYDCNWGGGYAGLRYANGCTNITTNYLKADHCGRGFFIVQSGPTVNCHLNDAEIYDCSSIGIWIENGTDCSVKAGCSESGVSVSGSGSYASVSSSCSGGGGGGSYVQIRNRGTGLYLDGMGRTTNGDDCGQWANSSSHNQQWEMIDRGSGYWQFKNRATGLFLDGMGRTTNGDDCGMWANTTHVNSQWSVALYSGNYRRFQNRGTGLYLDGMGRTSNGSAAGQWANTTHVNAQWELVSVSGSRQANLEDGGLEEPISVLIYPNPASNFLNVRLEHEEEIAFAEIFDVSGKLVLSQNISGQNNQVDIADVPKGIYFLELTTTTKSNRFKFIKQ